jgi:hypothetical protein
MLAQRGLGELRLLDFLTSALYGGRLSASRTGRLYPQGHERLSRPQGHGLVGRKYVTEYIGVPEDIKNYFRDYSTA